MNKFYKVSEAQYLKDILDGSKCTEEQKEEILKQLESIPLPKRSTVESAGYDFVTPVDITLQPGEEIKVATGIKMQLDPNKYLGLLPRSGHGFKYRLRLANTKGIVDADYYNNPGNEGHIFIKIVNEGKKVFEVKAGQAFAQGIISRYYLTDDDSVSAERVGGIGSTTVTTPAQ